MNALRIAPASLRNSEPILNVLRKELVECKDVLEIGSGTGQHAVYFAARLPHIHWQTSDLVKNHADIRAHIVAADLSNVEAPLALDVRDASIADTAYDAVYTCNTMHIMSFVAVQAMIPLVASVLRPGGIFCAYGPFRVQGAFSTQSNQDFDASLRAANSDRGIRDLESVDELAEAAGMSRLRSYAMPANNLLHVWIRN